MMRKTSSPAQTKKSAASDQRYSVPYLIYLSPTEDAELIADIESTYGRSKSERGRNYLRAHSGKDYTFLQKNMEKEHD
ncbi:MAG: hypothetical protein MJ014_00200 [Methanocorpusculum sp.]|nr:hypothetical protein [Methanocorpusculum sp.]